MVEQSLKLSPEDLKLSSRSKDDRELDLGKNIYFTDEVVLKIEGVINNSYLTASVQTDKYVNEFKIVKSIGKGAYSKVKKVIRIFQEEGKEHAVEYAMKMMHKPTLRRERAIRYSQKGEMEMINNLDKVYNEVEVWAKINHDSFIKMYELIDSDDHDYMYIIMELADLGQLATWDYKQELYIRNQSIYDTVLMHLQATGELRKDERELEQVAKFIFKQLIASILHLHEEMKIIHRDIKLDNILFQSSEMKVKVTDFTVSRSDIEDETRLFDCEGTPSFTAPECHIVESGGYLPKPTDIWSFGISLYAYVHGLVPFYSSGGELEMQINSRTNPVEIPPEFSPLLQVERKIRT